jgi:hypothetical protein
MLDDNIEDKFGYCLDKQVPIVWKSIKQENYVYTMYTDKSQRFFSIHNSIDLNQFSNSAYYVVNNTVCEPPSRYWHGYFLNSRPKYYHTALQELKKSSFKKDSNWKQRLQLAEANQTDLGETIITILSFN